MAEFSASSGEPRAATEKSQLFRKGHTFDTGWAFARYEAVRSRLPAFAGPSESPNRPSDPSVNPAPNQTPNEARPGVPNQVPIQAPVQTPTQAPIQAGHLGALTAEFDVFVLDAFGVLNVGETAVPGAPERVAALQAAGKRVYVLTNGAAFTAEAAQAKYRRLGFTFDLARVVASRDVLQAGMAAFPAGFRWGFMARPESRIEELSERALLLEDDPETYEAAEGFVLLASWTWTAERQERLVESLARRPRPVLVGNPDIVAPREDSLSLEPGAYAHDLADRTGIEPRFFGKPYPNAFEEVLRRLEAEGGAAIPRRRIAMVGDTLHTDVLGGAAAGFRTVLVTDHGLFKGRPVGPYIERSGIRPDFIIRTT